jgi:MFS family permease
MVVSGQGSLAVGLLVSAGNALLFVAVYWGRAGKRYGARNVMTFAFFALSATLLGAGLCGEDLPLVAGLFLLGGALFTIALDAIGSTTFMRAVHTYERPQMSAVYRTYLDLSELLPPLIYSVVLAFFGLGAVFATLGVFTAYCGWLTWRYVPKSM